MQHTAQAAADVAAVAEAADAGMKAAATMPLAVVAVVVDVISRQLNLFIVYKTRVIFHPGFCILSLNLLNQRRSN